VSVDHDQLMSLVRTAFGQRRKMLRRSLSGIVTTEQFEQAGIAPDDRPERLGVEVWGALTEVVFREHGLGVENSGAKDIGRDELGRDRADRQEQ
jgi:16S rRNA (adenine1518-N6/adenine1519-N6)-dimethyltransferase